MLEIGGDSWGWQKWESLWEPIDDDLYLRRGRCSSNTRQLAHNNNWMWCQYQTNKHNSNWTSNKQWKKSDLRLFFYPQLQDPKEKWKETSACVSLEQVWDSGMNKVSHESFPLRGKIFLRTFFHSGCICKSNPYQVDEEECGSSWSKQPFCWKSPIIRHYSQQHSNDISYGNT